MDSESVPITRIRHRRDTPENWTLYNPVLASGEIGIEEYDQPQPDRFKIGDGTTPWDELLYFVSEQTMLDDIDSALSDLSTSLGIGDIEDLTTEDNSSVVAAINELNMVNTDLEDLYQTTKEG